VVLLQVLLLVTNNSIKRAKTTGKVIQTRRRNEFIVQTNEARLLRVAASKFEVNNLVRFTADILGHHVNKRAEMLIADVVVIVFTRLNILLEQLRDDTSGKNWLQVNFLVGLEFLRSVQMDSKTGDLHERLTSMPVSALKFTISIDNDFTSQSQVSIKPSSPKTTTISHNIELLVTKAVIELRNGGELEHRGISMATDDLESTHRVLNALGTNEEGTDSRAISSEVVTLTSFKVPLVDFLNLIESILLELILAVIDSMEMGRRGVKALKDVLGVDSGLLE